ncbi:hypothetical protein K458DRAFT_434608 [Lentithecium fluviatile CBS 122367]|uniref:Uncharacterized protein n=1 Tax=Lentithecium fluviatile CBS 122367 TaxID=1168545 RepID=A0A6G1IPR8_9PLEO|nr:hypothetical protein K458DRAFT_434608 [Lentithecium fluviatile CBS 122367]
MPANKDNKPVIKDTNTWIEKYDHLIEAWSISPSHHSKLNYDALYPYLRKESLLHRHVILRDAHIRIVSVTPFNDKNEWFFPNKKAERHLLVLMAISLYDHATQEDLRKPGGEFKRDKSPEPTIWEFRQKLLQRLGFRQQDGEVTWPRDKLTAG